MRQGQTLLGTLVVLKTLLLLKEVEIQLQRKQSARHGVLVLLDERFLSRD